MAPSRPTCRYSLRCMRPARARCVCASIQQDATPRLGVGWLNRGWWWVQEIHARVRRDAARAVERASWRGEARLDEKFAALGSVAHIVRYATNAQRHRRFRPSAVRWDETVETSRRCRRYRHRLYLRSGVTTRAVLHTSIHTIICSGITNSIQ